jgi:hypothetical protein
MKKKFFIVAFALVTMLGFSGCSSVDIFKSHPSYMTSLTPMPEIIWSDYEWDWNRQDIDLINKYNHLVIDYNEILKSPEYDPKQVDLVRQNMMTVHDEINKAWGNNPERASFLNAFNQRIEYHRQEMGGNSSRGFENFNGRQLREFHKLYGGYAGLPETESNGNFVAGFTYEGFTLPTRNF